jgi:hypothetical protein
MGIGAILIAVGIVVLLMLLFWLLSRPRSGSIVRDDDY